MEFTILGPLRAWHNGHPVSIPGRHAPKLLALLLVDAGRAVTVTRLVEALWAENPPATAKRQVQNVMASLRRALPDPDVIEASGNGYRLRLTGNAVDYLEFERLRSLAREAEPREALRYLREASGLWRGEALAGLTGSVVEAAAVKLNEVRMVAVEDRMELSLEVDRGADVVGELRELVEAHPNRQRLVALLMRALWHTGRTPEALEVYEALRARLAEDLGLDPDRALVELHSAILRGEPEREAGRPEPVVARGPVPAQLPAAPSTFTGRVDHVAELDELLEQGQLAAVVSAIAGMGGAGKTALALHWGHRVRQRFPDGQLYINLRGYDEGEPVTAIDALGRFLLALGLPKAAIPTDVDEATGLFRTLIADRRLLVVLDNARNVEQVRPLLPGGAGNFALVTSRDRMASMTALDDERSIRLDAMSQEESLELLAKVVGAGRLHADVDAAHRLADLCGRLPLALRIAGANLGAHPEVRIVDFAETLAGPDRLRRLTIDGDARASVSNVLELSVTALDNTSRELLLKLALIPGEDFSRKLAFELSELAETAAAQHVSKLESAHLIEQHVQDRYRIHDLTRDFARIKANTTFDDTRLRRCQSIFINWHYAFGRDIPATEASNVLSAFTTWGDHPEVWKFATMFSAFVGSEFRPSHLLHLSERALADCDDDMDTFGRASLHINMAILHRFLGNRKTAIREAEIANRIIDVPGVGDSDGRFRANLAIMLTEAGHFTKAHSIVRGALDSARESGKAASIIACSSSLAALCRRLGQFADAETLLTGIIGNPDLPMSLSLGAIAKGQLGALYCDMGRYAEALLKFDDALSTLPDTGALRTRINIRIARAEVLRMTHAYEAAQKELTDIISVSRQAHLDGPMPRATTQLAEVFSDSGDQSAALRCLADFEPYDGKESDEEFAAEVARLHCLIHTRLRQFTTAVPHGARARDGYAAMSCRLLHARSLVALSAAFEGAGESERGFACRKQALAIFTDLDVPEANKVRESLRLP